MASERKINHIVYAYNLDRRVVRTWDFLRRQPEKDYIRLTLHPRIAENEGVTVNGHPTVQWILDSGTRDLADEELVMLTNSDSFLTADTLDRIWEARGLCYSCRVNMGRVGSELYYSKQLEAMGKYPGVDLVCFTVGWWRKIRAKLPRLYFGCEAWDWIFKWEILWSDGVEIGPVVYHQNHGPSKWFQNRLREPNLTNRRAAISWGQERGWERVVKVWPEIVQYLE